MLDFLRKQKKTQERFASTHKRLFAYTIDNLIVLVVRYTFMLICWFVWFKSAFTEFGAYVEHQVETYGQENLNIFHLLMGHDVKNDIIILLFLTFIIGALYYILLPVSKYKATFGKYLMKITLEDFKSKKQLSLQSAILRYIAGLVPWAVNLLFIYFVYLKLYYQSFFLMFVVVMWYEPHIIGRNKRAVHDYLCSTIVARGH
jgi:uncharacterized RDD family membrane protein YckC